MTTVLYRRNSMTLLSLYDLETFPNLSISNQTESDNRKIQLRVSPSKSLLEDLSNELLIDIFHYLSPCDLHRSLYNLNSHLNAICEVQKLRLNLSGSKRAFDYYYSHQQPFASQIYSLKLDDNYDRLKIFNQHMNINFFPNLRMLTINEPSSENLDKILSKLHTLSHLSYLNIYLALIQSSNITENIFKIRSLKHLLLYSTDPITFHFDSNRILPFTELEYIAINGCLPVQFLELLKYVGSNVKRMKIHLLYDRQQNHGVAINPTIIDEWLSNHQTSVFLHRLEMKFNFLSLTNFHLLLRLFPHLKHLTFSTLTSDIDFISPSIWYEFISTNLSQLTQLQFHMEIRDLLGNVIPCPSRELIDSFHSMNNKCLVGPVVMDYNSLLKRPVLEFYTYPQSVRTGKYSLELYGRKRYIATTMADVPINVDEKITHLHITLNDNQQLTTTNDQLSLYEASGIAYPKVTKIVIHSQMTRLSAEDDKKSRLIISDLIKSIPDLSKITTLNFTTDSSIYPSIIFARRLLDKLPKITRLELPCDYLLCLIKSPLIVKLLSKKIDGLTIEFKTDPPVLPDMIRILKVFSLKLRFLYFYTQMDFPTKKFYFILPFIFGELGKKLYMFRLRLWSRTLEQPEVFDEQFKSRLKNCLTAQMEKNKGKSNTMEYKIKDNEFLISF